MVGPRTLKLPCQKMYAIVSPFSPNKVVRFKSGHGYD